MQEGVIPPPPLLLHGGCVRDWSQKCTDSLMSLLVTATCECTLSFYAHFFIVCVRFLLPGAQFRTRGSPFERAPWFQCHIVFGIPQSVGRGCRGWIPFHPAVATFYFSSFFIVYSPKRVQCMFRLNVLSSSPRCSPLRTSPTLPHLVTSPQRHQCCSSTRHHADSPAATASCHCLGGPQICRAQSCTGRLRQSSPPVHPSARAAQISPSPQKNHNNNINKTTGTTWGSEIATTTAKKDVWQEARQLRVCGMETRRNDGASSIHHLTTDTSNGGREGL